MKISSIAQPYISGAEFSDGFFFDIKQDKVYDRLEVLDKMVAGKSVLHVGCVDHPLSSERLRSDRWLHGRLTQKASRCLGVDVNREGLEFMSRELGVENTCYADLTDPDLVAAIEGYEWEYVIFGEILEHIDNPVDFLSKFLANYGHRCKNIVLTVPNAFRAGNFSSALKSKEFINTDHKYWFSPSTIAKVVHQSGLIVDEIYLCKFSESSGFKAWIRNLILNRYPLLSEDVLLIAHVPNLS